MSDHKKTEANKGITPLLGKPPGRNQAGADWEETRGFARRAPRHERIIQIDNHFRPAFGWETDDGFLRRFCSLFRDYSCFRQKHNTNECTDEAPNVTTILGIAYSPFESSGKKMDWRCKKISIDCTLTDENLDVYDTIRSETEGIPELGGKKQLIINCPVPKEGTDKFIINLRNCNAMYCGTDKWFTLPALNTGLLQK